MKTLVIFLAGACTVTTTLCAQQASAPRKINLKTKAKIELPLSGSIR